MKKSSIYYAMLSTNGLRKRIRQAIADYMSSEGCSCCSDYEAHDKHKAILGKLLKVKMYKDKSGYDFYKYKSKAPTK